MKAKRQIRAGLTSVTMLDGTGGQVIAMKQIVGKRLTWDALTGKQPDSATCSN